MLSIQKLCTFFSESDCWWNISLTLTDSTAQKTFKVHPSMWRIEVISEVYKGSEYISEPLRTALQNKSSLLFREIEVCQCNLFTLLFFLTSLHFTRFIHPLKTKDKKTCDALKWATYNKDNATNVIYLCNIIYLISIILMWYISKQCYFQQLIGI